MKTRGTLRLLMASAVTASLTLAGATTATGEPGGGGGGADTGSVYSDLVVALRAPDGTPQLKEYAVPETEEAPATIEYCVQPASYAAVPGVTATENPLDGRDVWVIPLQGEWIPDPPTDVEIEACDPQPQYAMFVSETELERLNLSRTTEEVLARKIQDVETKLTSADMVSLDPAGRLSADGAALDAAPEYAAIYESLMTTGTIPGLNLDGFDYDAWQLAAVAIGTAASKGVPITVDTVQYYNRIVGFTALDPLPSWGSLSFLQSADPNPTTTPMPDVLPASENFVDYSGFTYNRSKIFTGAVTWLNVAEMEWKVTPILDAIEWTNLTKGAVNSTPLTGVTAFAQMADDTRSVISYLHEYEVVLPGFYMDPVLVDTYDEQLAAITYPAVQLTAPEVAFQTLPFVATSSLFNPWGGAEVADARVKVTIDKVTTDGSPAALADGDVTVSSGGVDLVLTSDGDNLVGWWEPLAEDDVMEPGYRASADFNISVEGDALGAGTDYKITFDLVHGVADTFLASDSSIVKVQPNVLSVLWGGEMPVLGTQGSYYTVPVRAYAPEKVDDAVLTFTLTGPGDDDNTTVLESLDAGEAKMYASDGSDMVSIDLPLTGLETLSGTLKADLLGGYNDLVWYLMVNEGAPVGQYGIDIGITGGTDLAEAALVTFAAPEEHGVKPDDKGEDTTAPVVTITLDAITSDSASFSFVANEEDVTFQTQLIVDDVKGDWEDAAAGTITYTGLLPGDYVFVVKATDAAGNTDLYVKKFTVLPRVVTSTTPTTPTTSPSPTPKSGPSTKVVDGPDNRAWVLDKRVAFVLDSDADDATYDVRLNRAAYEEQAGDTVTVKGLQPGLNKIRLRARVRGEVDSTPVVRTVYLPYGVRQTNRTRAWKMAHHSESFLNTFLSTSRSDQYVSVFAPKVRRIALVVTTAPRSGKVHVYLGSRRLTDKPISLRSKKVVRNRLMMVHQFKEAVRGQVRVVAVGDGRVRIEGIGIAK